MRICKFVFLFCFWNARQANEQLNAITYTGVHKQSTVQTYNVVHNSIAEGMVDTTSTHDNLLHLQIGHPRTSTLPHGQYI